MAENENTFDLRVILADRAYPTAVIPVLLEDKILWELAALHRRLDETVVSGEDPAEIEREIAKLEEERNSKLYRVHLRAISNRARDDLQRAALHAIPLKPDLYGREDGERTMDRADLLNELYLAAHVTKIVAPNGAEQVWTEANKRDLARAFLDNAPEHAAKILGEAIEALRGEEQAQYAKVTDIDFLSHT